jgi:hypothetical protein
VPETARDVECPGFNSRVILLVAFKPTALLSSHPEPTTTKAVEAASDLLK